MKKSLLFISILIFCAILIEKKQFTTGEEYKILTLDGAWCWFSEPRAYYYKGKFERIYAGWIDQYGNISVGYVDLKTRIVKTKILHENFEIDDHDHPVVYLDNEGFVNVYYTYHATPKPIYYYRSKYPENIELWEECKLLYLNDTNEYKGFRNSYTYANITALKKENYKQYLFWRGMDFKPNLAIKDSIWNKGKIFILPERIYKDRRPYLRMYSNEYDKIHFAFTDGHPRNEKYNSIYYMYYRNGKLYKANGDIIAEFKDIPIVPSKTDVVYDAKLTGEKAWIWDVAEDINGYPVIVYSRFPNDSNHLYYYSRWNGKKWVNYFVVNSGKWFPQTPSGEKEREPNYSGGMSIDFNDVSTIYISIQRNGIFEIEKWIFDKKTEKWSIKPITYNSKNHNVRPVVARNNKNKNYTYIFWMNIEKYIHYTDYKTSIRYAIVKN